MVEKKAAKLDLPFFAEGSDLTSAWMSQKLAFGNVTNIALGLVPVADQVSLESPTHVPQGPTAAGDDAKMLTTLSDPQVVSVSSVEDGWNVSWTES